MAIRVTHVRDLVRLSLWLNSRLARAPGPLVDLVA